MYKVLHVYMFGNIVEMNSFDQEKKNHFRSNERGSGAPAVPAAAAAVPASGSTHGVPAAATAAATGPGGGRRGRRRRAPDGQ